MTGKESNILQNIYRTYKSDINRRFMNARINVIKLKKVTVFEEFMTSLYAERGYAV